MAKIESYVWEEFGVYPSGQEMRIDHTKNRLKARKLLEKLPKVELSFLCDQFELQIGENPDSEQLAQGLLEHIPDLDILCLYEFAKRRGAAINWVAEKDANISRQLRGLQTAKPETRLLLIYRQGIQGLRNVFYYAAWQSASTATRLIPESSKYCAFVQFWSDNHHTLADRIGASNELGCSVIGHHELPDKSHVYVLQRNYSPRVSRDYRNNYNVHHGCGLLVFGMSSIDRSLHVKCANREVIDSIQLFVDETFESPVTRNDHQTASVTSFKRFDDAIVAGEPIDGPLTLCGVSFRRTVPTGQPVSLPDSGFFSSVSPILQQLNHAEITRGLTLLDVEQFTLRYRGRQIEVFVRIQKNGAVNLTYENKGIPDQLQVEFQDELLRRIGLPIGIQIDPKALRMGAAPVVASLLKTSVKADVEDFQKPVLRALEEKGVIETVTISMLRCSNNFCTSTPVFDEADSGDHCRICGHSLQRFSSETIKADPIRVVTEFGTRASKANADWRIKPGEQKFEGLKFRLLVNDSKQLEDQSIVVLPKERLTPNAEHLLDRLGRPVIALDSQYSVNPGRIRRDGYGVFSIPQLLAASISEESVFDINAAAAELIDNVVRTYSERIHRSARVSAKRLRERKYPGNEKGGKEFEVDVFNISRVIFPYAIQLGRVGKPEPDGILPLSTTDSSSTADFVVGYDAKLNLDGDGYSLPRSEQRKVKDYIQKYRRSKTRLGGIGRKIAAHAFISNDLRDKQIRKLMEYLYGEDGLPKNAQDVRCISIDTIFLLDIFEKIEESPVEFQRRRASFERLFVELCRIPDRDYVRLGLKEAEALLQETWNEVPEDDRVCESDIHRAFQAPAFKNLGKPVQESVA